VRVVRRESDFIQEEVIANENGWLHRFRRNLRGLGNQCRECEDKYNGTDETFAPLTQLAFSRSFVGRGERQFFKTDVGNIEVY